MQILQGIHDYLDLMQVHTQYFQGIKGGERGAYTSMSPFERRPISKSYSRWHREHHYSTQVLVEGAQGFQVLTAPDSSKDFGHSRKKELDQA